MSTYTLNSSATEALKAIAQKLGMTESEVIAYGINLMSLYAEGSLALDVKEAPQQEEQRELAHA